ncbi:hypothetical protein SCLCIDRAFT_1225386, partial [Scleroderma citrinum Foug A]
NRFLIGIRTPISLGERAASQPPPSDSRGFLSSPSQQHTIPSNLSGSTSSPPWSPSSRMHSFSTSSRTPTGGLRSSIPTRSPSLSNHQAISDTYDTYDILSTTPVADHRPVAPDLTHSRSQSLMTATRPGGPLNFPASSLTSNPLNIPGSCYGDIKPPGSSQYGSLGTLGRSPLSNHYDSPSGNGNNYAGNRQTIDPSNMSPFVRDVSQIPLDDGSALRKLWSGMNPPKAENGGGGTSIIQPRRPVVGFNAPGHDAQDESARPSVFPTSIFGRGGLMLDDNNLASDLNMLSLSKDGPGPSSSSAHPPSQPSSLPIYAPMSRSPLSPDRVSPYQPINLNIPSGTSYISRQRFSSPSDSGLSAGASPPRSQLEQQLMDAQCRTGGNNGHAGRTDLFYLTDLTLDIRVGDLVIVEADQGKDLGTVVNDTITLKEVEAFEREQRERVAYGDGGPLSPGGQQGGTKKEINPKMIYGKVQQQDTQQLTAKLLDEIKALQLCQNKVRQKKLPMEVIDAEYQWDRRKLTFYFVAEKRIDFRELVRELFRLYKTRIWMASLQGPGGYEQ